MKYKGILELPDAVRTILPEEAQALYVEGYNRGWDMYDEETSSELSRSSVAHREGWAAVQREFVQDEGTGKWYRRGEEPERPESRESAGLLGTVRTFFRASGTRQ
jgi:cation transport regulator ChaB